MRRKALLAVASAAWPTPDTRPEGDDGRRALAPDRPPVPAGAARQRPASCDEAGHVEAARAANTLRVEAKAYVAGRRFARPSTGVPKRHRTAYALL